VTTQLQLVVVVVVVVVLVLVIIIIIIIIIINIVLWDVEYEISYSTKHCQLYQISFKNSPEDDFIEMSRNM
jgi:hypothetical protein